MQGRLQSTEFAHIAILPLPPPNRRVFWYTVLCTSSMDPSVFRSAQSREWEVAALALKEEFLPHFVEYKESQMFYFVQ